MLTTLKNRHLAVWLAAVLLFVSSFSAKAGHSHAAQADIVTVNFTKTPFATVIKELQKQTSFKFIYNSSLIDKDAKITFYAENKPLSFVLKSILPGLGMDYELKEKQVVIFPAGGKKQSPKLITISGRITDGDGLGLPGVTVRDNEQHYSISDNDGYYIIRNISGNGTLSFDCIGMETVSLDIAGRTNIDVKMKEARTTLDEVVVTGYQTLSKERAPGSYGVVSTTELGERLNMDIKDRLKGKIAGMTSYRGTTQIRGRSTINGNSEPLYVVDGVPYEGSLSAINPSEIVNVTVLKDATAASIYGARSANGIIVITTRSGESGPTRVSYNGSVKLTPLVSNRGYQNLMTSSEFVDFQRELFEIDPMSYQPQYALNEVRALLFQHKEGTITSEQLDEGLDYYRNLDNAEQLRKQFLRSASVQQQHNLSLSGGAEKHKYALSLNYNSNAPYEKGKETDNIGFRLRNTFKFFDWFNMDVSFFGRIIDNEYNNGFSAYSIYSGTGSVPTYRMLFDENGVPVHWYQQKSQLELDRLTGLGLLDESYYPVDEFSRTRTNNKSNYLNFNANLNFRIIDGLTLDVRYATDIENAYQKTFNDKNAYSVRHMINDATQIKDGEIIQNIPVGGQIRETRSDRNSYTLRAQANYDRLFGEKHRIVAIAGSEIRAIKSSGTSTFNVGYDDNSLVYKPINEKDLAQIQNTESLTGRFSLSNKCASYSATENRYVSFYANASYTFNNRVTATASIRMDQSNLFGTDPKYQYRPLWSAGLHYVILNGTEVSWIDRLAVRATYGINGNVAKQSGPYLTVTDSGVNDWTGEYQSTVSYPPNSGLRWEKTAVTNIAVDFNLFKGRLNGSVEFYNKATSDLLHNKTYDPTYGWGNVMVNYGDMLNRGVELSLSSINVKTKDFIWTSDFNFSYNKNELIRIENTAGDAINYLSGLQTREGLPLNSIYSVRWAGLDETGAPQAYKKDGTVVKSMADIEVDDLVYSGTITPPYAASFSNTLRWKELSLSFMFSYYGGHHMKGVFGDFITGTGISVNPDRLTADFWRKPGDENNPDTTPARMKGINANVQNLWKAADRHIQKGDYIKLENIVLSYRLPQNVLKNTFIKGVKFSCQIDNAGFVWVANSQGLNPESWSGSGLSSSRGQRTPTIYSLGVALDF